MTTAARPHAQPAPAASATVARPWADAARLLAIVALCLAVYAAFIPRIITDLSPLTGDEPYYVMTAISLTRDGDLDEINNYQQADYAAFYPPDPLPADWRGWPAFPRVLPPHPANSQRAGLYSKHGLGVVLLITPPYIWGGRVAVILLLNAVAALVAANMALLARRYGVGWPVATLLALLVAFSNPLMSYAYLIFPEVFAALAIVYAFRRSRAPANNGWQWLGVGIALATLPWLHARFIPAVLGLAWLLFAGWRREPSRGRRLAALLPPALSALALITYYLLIYGKPFPSAADHAGFNWPREIVNAFFGLFLDEQWGLVIYAPLYLLAGAGLIVLWRRARPEARALLAVLGPYLAMIAFYAVWWGEWGPPARYLAPVAPLAVAPIAAWARAARPWGAAAGVGLLALPGLAIMAGFLRSPQLMYNQPTGNSALFSAWAAELGRVWPKVIPSFQFYSPSPPLARLGWSFALIGVVCLLALLGLGRTGATAAGAGETEAAG